MYHLDENQDFSELKEDGMPVRTRTCCVISKHGKSAIYIPCKGTIEDIYLLVHELSHTFDFIGDDNPTSNILGEVTPHCFEAMLSQYLLDNDIASPDDIANRERGTSISHYDDGVETFAKLELMRIKEQKGEITQDDIIKIQTKYGITDSQLDFILKRLTKSERNVDYRARYMIAQLVYPHYIREYKQNPRKALGMLKDFFEQIRLNDFNGSLKALEIEPRIESVYDLIDECNRKLYYPEGLRDHSDVFINKNNQEL